MTQQISNGVKSIVISTFIAIAIIGGVIVVMIPGDGQSATASVENVSVVDGKQIVEINAKGQYSPKVTSAKAGIPTVLRSDSGRWQKCDRISRKRLCCRWKADRGN